MKLIVLLLFPLFYLILPLSPVIGSQPTIARLEYDQDETETIQLWLRNGQARTDLLLNGQLQHSIVFDSTQEPLTLYLLEGNQAIKLTRPALERVTAHLNIRYEQMRQQLDETYGHLSEEIRQELIQDLPKIDPINLDTPPLIEFSPEEKIDWQQRPAEKGSFLVEGVRRDTAILLKEPVIELSDGQRETLENFQGILFNWIEIVRRQPEFTGGENPYEETQNLIINYFPRLVRLTNGVEIRLTDWQLKPDSPEPFELPDDLQIQEIDRGLFN